MYVGFWRKEDVMGRGLKAGVSGGVGLSRRASALRQRVLRHGLSDPDPVYQPLVTRARQ